MDKKLLDIICCPVSRLPLELLDAERLTRLNTAIARGGVHNHAEQTVSAALAEALVSRDGRLVYPIRDGIPILLAEECIAWNQLPA